MQVLSREVERYRKLAEEARQHAAKAVNPREKQALLETASEWTKIAEDAQQRTGEG